MATTEQPARYTGQPVRRKEDAELLTGQSRYTDDIAIPGMLWMAMVRSPYAHARIKSIDVSKALGGEGVVAAYSAADLESDIGGPLVMAWPVAEGIKTPPHWPLTKDKARYVGDGVAVVVATSRALAKDAAELVEVDYEPLPAVTDVEAALADGAPLLYEDLGTNECYTWTFEKDSPAPRRGDPAPIFATADVVVKERYRIQRAVPNAIEPRSVLVQPNPSMGEYTMWSASQIPHIVRTCLALECGIQEAKLRIIAPDVGGGFGSKLEHYAEEVLCLALARKLGQPIKWTEERSEAYLATIHGRDVVQEIELAATNEGRVRAVRVKLICSMGAYLQIIAPGIPVLGAWLYGGCYDLEGYDIEIVGVFTNNTPTDAYRGAGRPEATYAIERAMDALARKVGMDPVAIRKLNFISKSQFPNHTIVSGLTVDSGDYETTLDKLLQVMDYRGLRQEQDERRARGDGKLLGIGFSTWLEMCGLAPSRVAGAIHLICGLWEAAEIRCLPTGTCQVLIGVTAHGQGHATTFSQMVADQLGFAYDEVEVLAGDTLVVPLGMDTYGSRSLAVGGMAVHNAGLKIIAKARKVVAHALEVAEEDLDYDGGRFTVKGTDRSMTVKEVAFAAWTAHDLPDGMEPGLGATYVYDPPNFSWPHGAHACVVEVDPETGSVDIVKYVAVDDCGNQINPQVVEGQVHGGVAQGIAEALFEEAIYDEDGNLVTGSMASYMIPAASELPSFTLDNTVTPSPTNPLGVKGIGEAGTIGCPPAVINAIVDALSPLGVTNMERPASPERVWRAIQEAKQ
jgi:aerobic carbon-monoxide dehydrogenase large subunit